MLVCSRKFVNMQMAMEPSWCWMPTARDRVHCDGFELSTSPTLASMYQIQPTRSIRLNTLNRDRSTWKTRLSINCPAPLGAVPVHTHVSGHHPPCLLTYVLGYTSAATMPVPPPSGAKIRDLPGFYYGKYHQPYKAIVSFTPQPSVLLTYPPR